MGISMEAQKEAILEKSKKTMSVPEMRRLLGLKKTDSYWLVHRNFFQTHIVNGQMRVDIASFEKWYANQVKHKKVNGEEPGAELMKSSYSFRDAANLLGIHSSNLYEIWRDQNLKTITVDFTKRIPIEVFEEWYEHQIMYQKVGRMPTITDLEKTISVCRMQRIFLESQKKNCQSLPGRAGLGSILKSACLRIKSGSPKRASNTS